MRSGLRIRQRQLMITAALLMMLLGMGGVIIERELTGSMTWAMSVGDKESRQREFENAKATWVCSPRSQSLDPGFTPGLATRPLPTPGLRANVTPYARQSCS